MKLLIVSRAMGCYYGGTEDYELSLAANLKSAWWEVDFVISHPFFKQGKIPEKLSGFKYSVCRVPFLKDIAQRIHPLHAKFSYYVFLLDNWLFRKTCMWQMKKVLSKKKYDVIQFSGQIDLACEVKDFVSKETAVIDFLPCNPDLSNVDKIQRLDGLFTNGCAYFLARAIHPRAELIHGGCETALISEERVEEIKRFHCPNGESIILMVNRLVPLKNIEKAISIMAQLRKKRKDFKLIIIGDGPLWQPLSRLIITKWVEDVVELVGKVSHDRISDYYAAATVFLMTSSFDNGPRVILEAMSMWCPIVAENGSGPKLQLINKRNGFLCLGIGDYETALEKLLDNDVLRKNLKNNNIEDSREKYNWQVGIRQYNDLIFSILPQWATIRR